MKEPCYMCLNARVDDELTDSNDLSYCTVNYFEGHRIVIRSGAGRPTAILAEEYSSTYGQWVTVNSYEPKFCPNCGRELDEYGKR